jgi:hypothetical protein
LLCCVSVAAGVVPDSEDAAALPGDVLAAALEANRELVRLAGELREENARLRAQNAEQAAELEGLRADLAVCSGWCSAGRRRGRGRRGRPAVIPLVKAVLAAAEPGTAGGRTLSGARGRGRGGGITRTCPRSR